MALNGAEGEDNFCHKSAVMQTVCSPPPVVESEARPATLCPLRDPARQDVLAGAGGLSIGL